MLAERMAAGVAAGVYSVEHMAAVTFTRKAASELRGRFHLALEEELKRAHKERTDRVQAALSNLERFFAGTIHSFCARLLRERPVESGVSPGFTELDEVQDLELRRRVWRDFISGARGAGDADMMALMEADIRPSDLDSAFSTICANDDVEFPPGEAECPDPERARVALDKYWRDLHKHLPSKIDPATTCLIQNAARDFQGQMRVSRYRMERPAVIAALLGIWDCDSKITQKWWAESSQEKKRLRDLIQDLHGRFRAEVIMPYLAQWRQYVYRLSVTLLTRAREYATAERRRMNSLNYADLLNLTSRVLRENEVVRRALQQKFRHLLVDEFQDTDPVQAEILFWLAEDGARSLGLKQSDVPDWRQVSLRPGSLFIVGDPKQSIYRFRRADIDIYNLVRKRFNDPAIGRVVPLTLNFRSVPQLCAWANATFQARFPAEPTAYAPRFTRLDANRSDSVTGGVFTMTHSCDRNELPERDAERIATYIRSEVDAGRRRFSDFLILTRKKAQRIAPYADALESRNIPVEVSGAGAFGESIEVKAVTVLLRALADPQDALSLIAVLRGPLFGISDPELFAFRNAGGWFSIFYGSNQAAETPSPSRVNSALAALQRYYRWTRILPAAAALERILEDMGYLNFAATSPGGTDAGDVVHAIDRLRQVAEEGGCLADAADAFDADSEATSEVERLPLEPARSNVVRVMNLHKAKGLEADVVFLADPDGGFKPRVDVHIERTELKARGWLKLVRKTEGSFGVTLLGEHLDWAAHEAAEMPYLSAEEDRSQYVAATRAREMVVISRSTERLKSPAWIVLDKLPAQALELPPALPTSVLPQPPLDCGLATRTLADAARNTAYEAVNQPSWAMTSVTAEARHIENMTPSADAPTDDPSKVVTTNTPSHRADAGLAWGTLIHGLLEHAMRHKNASYTDLYRLATWLSVEEPQLRVVLDQAVQTVLEVSKAEFWQTAVLSEHSVETPFMTREGPHQIVSGVVDLMFREPKLWKIVDYKTDVEPDNLSASYAQQLKMYERALATVGIEKAVSEIHLVRIDEAAMPSTFNDA
jgi:ATP-dependent helicase/nuclease subunit A